MTRFHRLFVRIVVWHGTERIASRLHGWTRWTQEPNADRWGRWWHTLFAGLNVACWTHVCGHGLRYAFDTGSIYWFPRYAKRRLRLPDLPH